MSCNAEEHWLRSFVVLKYQLLVETYTTQHWVEWHTFTHSTGWQRPADLWDIKAALQREFQQR